MPTYPYFIIRAPYPAFITRIRLPNPQLGETESNPVTMTLKHSMVGGLYTYVKTNPGTVIDLNFLITRSKSEEFKRFLLSYATKKVLITDHLDRSWEGYFITNPIEFITVQRGSPGGGSDMVEVNIEFEGETV